MTCPKCEKNIPNGCKFCPACGAAIKKKTISGTVDSVRNRECPQKGSWVGSLFRFFRSKQTIRQNNILKAGSNKIIILPGGAKMEMIYCPPGEFMMGSPMTEKSRLDRETQHRVMLTKGFWLGKYPVTQKQWKSVMGNNPSEFKGDSLPVERVSWDDCQGFIAKVNASLGCGARLPTEAEWEYACRAGTTGAYGGTGNIMEMGWYNGNSDCRLHPVGQKKPNAWGVYDMHGNVEEWCNDWYGDYPSESVTDPKGSAPCGIRVLRGGSCVLLAFLCRSAFRAGRSPGDRDYDGDSHGYGFRLCCSAINRGS